MKIAFVFDGLMVGGIERVGIDYIRMFANQGHAIEVFNLTPSKKDMCKEIPQGIPIHNFFLSSKMCPEIYSYGIQKWWWGKYAYPIISCIIEAFQFIVKVFRKRDKFDVAIAFSGHINDLNFVSKEFILASKKIVWCHGSILGYLAICDAYSILYKKIDCLVTLSSAGQKDIYPGHNFFYKKRIKKIYNPTYIRAKEISQTKVQIITEQFGDFVLMIARAEWQKGHDIAIKAMKELRNRGIKKNIVFLGDGSDLVKIKQFAEKEDVADQCFFLGNQSDVNNYIEASYVNILTSRWEGLPTVIVEAMTMGKPCIMTNCDNGEVSENGRYCILTENENFYEVADGLQQLYCDKNEYERFSKLSLMRAMNFTPEKINEEIENMLQDLINC